MRWTKLIDYHNKPKDLESILFVTPICPWTGERNRTQVGYVMYGETDNYEEAIWYSWEFANQDGIGSHRVESWMPIPRYEEEI